MFICVVWTYLWILYFHVGLKIYMSREFYILWRVNFQLGWFCGKYIRIYFHNIIANVQLFQLKQISIEVFVQIRFMLVEIYVNILTLILRVNVSRHLDRIDETQFSYLFKCSVINSLLFKESQIIIASTAILPQKGKK
jgi:hypothetical protein